MKILLAEMDTQLASALVHVLTEESMSVDLVSDGRTAMQLGEVGSYACAIINDAMPEIGGVAVITQWRKTGNDFPVLLLSATDGWHQKSEGFAAGADDYLVKPFLTQELRARVKALSRRTVAAKPLPMTCGSLTYYPGSENFAMEDRVLCLTSFEHRILTRLMLSRETMVRKSEILSYLYEGSIKPSNSSLEVIIGRLRRKIGFTMIETMRGYGYRLTSRVHSLSF